ncbi:integration host factor subunit alpha [bacterium]|nr:integration host factor subunit alpha [bacterium]
MDIRGDRSPKRTEIMSNNKSCLTKADLAEAIFNLLPVDKQKAAQVVEDYIELIKEALEKENKVMLSGFGSYEVKYKPPRRGRNPQTGESIILRARRVVKFKPSQLLRKAINGQAIDEANDLD